jgi:hypothetical protein
VHLADELATVLGVFRGLTYRGAPLRATADEHDVNPPCVFVAPPDIAFRFAKDRSDVTWVAYLVGPNTTTGTAGDALAELVDTVAGAFPFTAGAYWQLTLPGGGTPTRAYQLTWSDTIPIGV